MRRAISVAMFASVILFVMTNDPLADEVGSQETNETVCSTSRSSEFDGTTEHPKLCQISDDGNPVPFGGPVPTPAASVFSDGQMSTADPRAMIDLLDFLDLIDFIDCPLCFHADEPNPID